jgi:hypothetical protein
VHECEVKDYWHSCIRPSLGLWSDEELEQLALYGDVLASIAKSEEIRDEREHPGRKAHFLKKWMDEHNVVHALPVPGCLECLSIGQMLDDRREREACYKDTIDSFMCDYDVRVAE